MANKLPLKPIAGAGGAALLAILAAVFANEGGYVNDRNDPGGATNHGVTERVARKAGYKGDMRKFPKHCLEINDVCADAIYTRDYIEKPGYLPIVETEPAIAEELVDSAVNFGPARPSRWLQESLNTLDNAGLKADARVGRATIAALEAYRRKRGDVAACATLLKMLDAKQAVEYERLVTMVNPKLRAFIFGWMRTRIGNVDPAKCGGNYAR